MPGAKWPVMKGGLAIGDRVMERSGRRGNDLSRFTLSEIQKLILYRNDGGPCRTDDGEPFVEAAGSHIPELATLRAWAQRWVPLVEVDALLARLDPIQPFPRRRADSMGNLLRLKEQERSALGIKTIGAYDFTKAQRTAARKAKDRDYQAAQRAKQGRCPRAYSVTQQKPWIAAGMSRATWYRRERETVSSASAHRAPAD